MSKKLKKLLCGLLACAMLAGSYGMSALAADDDAAASEETEAVTTSERNTDLADRGNEEETEDIEGVVRETAAPAAEATEAPAAAATEAPAAEATEAPATEATEAPAEETTTAAGKAYDDDSYYKKALSLCTALGIITGYEDGSVKPESSVTRAEMSAIILRVLHTEAVAYRNLYTDVDSSHWAADTIEAATEKNIVNGFEDSTFRPDNDVLFEQVQKMIVCAMNYENEAVANGGWPTGYTRVAQQNLKLMQNVSSKLGTAAPRGEVIKMVYNALLGPYKELQGTDKNGNAVYTSNNTLAYVMYDVLEGVGVVTATSKKALSGNTVSDNQVKIEGTVYETTVENLDDYVGKKVTFYYTDNLTTDQTVIALYSDSSKTETVTINADDIDELTGIAATSPNGQLKTKGKNKATYKMAEGLQVLYNGTVITPDLYTAALIQDRNKDKTKRFQKVSYENDIIELLDEEYTYQEFITPEIGTVTLIDYDVDGKYDVMDVLSYENFVISSATDDSVKGTIKKVKSVTLDTNNDADDKTITVIKAGDEVKPRNLRKNDVASLARNLDGTTMSIIVSGESITGEITAISVDDDDTLATISGTDYVIDLNAVEDCKSGTEGSFYLDSFDRIGYVSSSSSGKLNSTEKYGWLMTTYRSDDGEDVIIKLYSQDGQVVEKKMTSSISYWEPNADSATRGTKEQILALSDNAKFIKTTVNGSQIPVRLVKYKVNSKDEISQLYVASAKTDTNANSSGVIVDVQNMRNKGASGNFIQGYMLEDGGLQFNVPSSADDMSTASSYSIETVTASRYLNVEGVGTDFNLGEFKDSRYPQVLIRYSSTGGTSLSPITDYGTANNNPTMMITNIGYGKDDDGEMIYTIKGYSGGATVSYTTCSTTGIYYMASANGVATSSIQTSKEAYKGETIFDATKDGSDKFYEAIKVGDVVGVQSSGSTANVIIKMVDAENIATDTGTNNKQWLGSESFSSTRDSITVGKVNSADLESEAFMTVGDTSVSFDSGKVLDAVVVTLDENGNVLSSKVNKEGGYDIVKVQNTLDDPDVEDFAFVRQFKGDMREIFIFRVQHSN